VLILLYETNPTLIGISFLLIFFRYGFFLSLRLLTIYLAFELVSMPVVLIIYKEGSQPEKLLAIIYMLSYTGFVSAAFLYIVVVVDMGRIHSGLTQCLLVGLFLAKRPLYMFHR
jgi:hypothetical protein